MHININIVYKLVYITADGKASSIFRSLYTTQEFHLLSANIRIMLCPRRESILEVAHSFLLSFYFGQSSPPHGDWTKIVSFSSRGHRRCRLSWLTTIASSCMSLKCGGGVRGLSQWVQLCCPNKLWKSNSIFNLTYASHVPLVSYISTCTQYCWLLKKVATKNYFLSKF
jgi:hypothetical protein